MRGLLEALSLLTRLPIGTRAAAQQELASSVRWFPTVGALVGIVVGGAYALSALWLPSLVASLIAVLIGVLITGGLHEDGLGDVADAFGGGVGAADAARILKDPRHGTFGVLAIASALFLRAVGLGSMSPIDGLAMAVGAHAIARTVVVVAMRIFRSGGEGLAATYSRGITIVDVLVALGLGAGASALASGLWVVASLAIALVGMGIIGWLSFNKLGALTGDGLGAIEQVAETGIFVLGAAIAHQALLRPAWWA